MPTRSYEIDYLPVSVSLVHLRVDKEAGVAKLANLAGKKLYTLGTVAKNDCLRNVQLGEQSVEAVELLTLLQKGVVLGQTLQSQLICNLDVLRSR